MNALLLQAACIYSILFLILPQSVFASSIEQLSTHPTWLKLGVYQKSKEGFKSEIKSSSFFISQHGINNPYTELKATIRAFEEKNLNFICKYQGRLTWLNKVYFKKEIQVTPKDCPEYFSWSDNNSAPISVIFATGYFKNPASYYGHLFLKISQSSQNSLNQASVNFGAKIPPNENILAYIIKGLFGAYKSSYTSNQFYTNVQTYSETDLRDMWEYELTLSSYHQKLLLGHTWEILREEYKYLFLSKNCVYRISELIGITNIDNTLAKHKIWVTPQDFIQRIFKAKINNTPILKSVKYLPSRQSKLYKRYARLSETSKTITHLIAKREIDFSSKKFTSLDIEQKHAVLDTLIDYYQFLLTSKVDEKASQKRYNETLIQRYLLPPGNNTENFSGHNYPHKGRNSSHITVATLRDHSNNSSTTELSVRPAYYDALDGDKGHVPFSTLKMGELTLTLEDGDAKLTKLTVVEIQSIQGNYTSLPNDRARSWSMNIGASRGDIYCPNCLNFSAFGELGLSSETIRNKMSNSVFLGAGFLDNKVRDESFYSQLSIQTIARINNKINMLMRIEKKFRSKKSKNSNLESTLQIRYSINKNNDLRIGYSKNSFSEISTLKYGHYW